MSDEWFLQVRGRVAGPVSRGRIRALAEQRRIATTDLARRGESGPWLTVQDVLDAEAAPAPAAATTAPSSTRWLVTALAAAAACIVGLLLLVAVLLFKQSSSSPTPATAPLALAPVIEPPPVPPTPAPASAPDESPRAAKAGSERPSRAEGLLEAVEAMAAEDADAVQDAELMALMFDRVAPADAHPVAAELSGAETNTVEPTAAEQDVPDAEKSADRAETRELADLVEASLPSVVKIELEDGRGGGGCGSGFVIDRRGAIATNFHVIERTVKGRCLFSDGGEAKIRGVHFVDTSRDLAVLDVDPNEHELIPVRLANEVPRLGENIFCIGSPMGLSFRVTSGVLSGITLTREIEKEFIAAPVEMKYGPNVRWLQSDTAISGGNSGGPWFNAAGEVVGVATWMFTVGQSLSFASAITELHALLEKEMSDATFDQPSKALAVVSKSSGRLRIGEDPDAKRRDEARQRYTVELPSGRKLELIDDLAAVAMELLSRRVFNPQLSGQHILKLLTPQNRLVGYASYRDMQLDGLSVVYNESERPQLLAAYKQGERHGHHALYNAEGLASLLMVFDYGQREGLICFLRDRKPYVVREAQRGSIVATHLVTKDRVFEDIDLDHLPADVPEAERQAAPKYVKQCTEEWREADKALRVAFDKALEDELRLVNAQKRAAARQRQKARQSARNSGAAQGVGNLLRNSSGS